MNYMISLLNCSLIVLAEPLYKLAYVYFKLKVKTAVFFRDNQYRYLDQCVPVKSRLLCATVGKSGVYFSTGIEQVNEL